VTFDYNRERLRKEKANYDVEFQSTTKYQQESKSKKKYKIPLDKIQGYLNASDKNTYLLKYAKCEVIG
jgi:hypothetical protein